LEKMARLIYREWFVYFRFPGHEDVAVVASDLGPVPEGWVVQPVGEVVDTIGGGTPSKNKPEYWADPSVVWYTPSDLTKQPAMFALGSGDQINKLGLSKSSAKLFPARTVMMTSRATIGEIAIATTEASTNQGFISCVPNERLSEYHLYFWLHDNVGLFLTLASGATFKELRKSTFRDLPIAVPPIELESRFNDAVGSMCELIENLLRRNEVLAEARDLLLPRLISGELDVSDLDLDLEPVA
jgi:type I restriction enzyme, S subunit